jgi:hypothetical protein
MAQHELKTMKIPEKSISILRNVHYIKPLFWVVNLEETAQPLLNRRKNLLYHLGRVLRDNFAGQASTMAAYPLAHPR